MTVRKALFFVSAMLMVWMTVAVGRWAMRFADQTTLPNGMRLERNFAFPISDRHDLVSGRDGKVLARYIDFVCFDDRYVRVSGLYDGGSGIYDGVADRKLAVGTAAHAAADAALSHTDGGCNGYYRALIGPGLLYDE